MTSTGGEESLQMAKRNARIVIVPPDDKVSVYRSAARHLNRYDADEGQFGYISLLPPRYHSRVAVVGV